jgi:hypothetical protein
MQHQKYRLMKISKNLELVNLSAASKKYLLENKGAFALSKRYELCSSPGRVARLGTIRGIVNHIANDLFSGSFDYLKALILGWREISKLSSIKGTKHSKRAIVIGNGPSQDFVTYDALQTFKNNGNDVFVINYWNENDRLSKISPSYFVTSDPNILVEIEESLPSDISRSNSRLKEYLKNNLDVSIMAPIWQTRYLSSVFGASRVIGFVDNEMRALGSNIDPRFPRGYVSMTLYKSLALAVHMGYKEIYLIGMDNTYPRDIFCDSSNHIYRRERHAGGSDYLVDMTSLLPSMDVQMEDIFNLFYDLRKCFAGLNVLNLDCYSLTDVFPKVANIDEIDILLKQ